MSAPARSDALRQVVHISMAGFALLLRWIPWWLAAALAATALLFNLTLLPRLGAGRLMRKGEREAISRSGVALYAVAVLLLVLVFRHHLEVAACAWGILAFGDGFSTLVGRAVRGPRLPWNPEKSWSGTAAFLIFGTVGGWGLLAWVAPRYEELAFSSGVALLWAGCGSLLGALIESLPLEVNDNLSVPLLAGGLIYSLGRVEPSLWSASDSALGRSFSLAVGVNLLFALSAKALGAVSWSGVLGGLAVGITIATFTGMKGFAVLAFFFILGSVATRIGYRSKARRGIAQEKGGARGWVHAVANGGVAAYLAFLAGSTTSPLREALLVGFVAALATAACDTLGSEVGPFSREDPILLTRLKRVPAGTPGAVSVLGTAAGVAAALAIGLAATFLEVIPPAGVAVVTVAALLGSLLESILGGTLEPLGLISSETSNFVNTLVGALTALFLFAWVGGGP